MKGIKFENFEAQNLDQSFIDYVLISWETISKYDSKSSTVKNLKLAVSYANESLNSNVSYEDVVKELFEL